MSTAETYLTEAISEFGSNRRGHPWPSGMPQGPKDAARWWIGIQEPPKDTEEPREIRKGGETVGFRFPYIERLMNNLRRFIELDHDKQRLILAAREDRIYWRGDDCETRLEALDGMTPFELVISETERAREIGIDQFKGQAAKQIENFIRQREEAA